MSETEQPELFTLAFDCDQKAVGCVLIQAAYGCDSSLVYRFGFNTETWLLAPSSGMKIIQGTEEQWKKAAEMSNATHSKKTGNTDASNSTSC